MATSFEVLSGNRVVAVWANDKLTITDNSRVPLLLSRVKDLDFWLESRAIDRHRTNSRLLKKALRITEHDDAKVVLSVNGATVTDNYWVRPVGSSLQYEDVRFSDDFFSSLALRGDYDSFNSAAQRENSKTPELTAVGSYEKCWKLENGEWWMYKQATTLELFSELFVSRLGQSLSMNMAYYEQSGRDIKTRNFTGNGKYNFEPASALLGDNEEYLSVIAKLQTFLPQSVPDYIRMIYLDTICANPDRHTNNFGFLRDAESGEYVGLAPNYDNNLALIAKGYPKTDASSDMLVRLFKEVIEKYPEYAKYTPLVTKETVEAIACSIDLNVDTSFVSTFVSERSEAVVGDAPCFAKQELELFLDKDRASEEERDFFDDDDAR